MKSVKPKDSSRESPAQGGGRRSEPTGQNRSNDIRNLTPTSKLVLTATVKARRRRCASSKMG